MQSSPKGTRVNLLSTSGESMTLHIENELLENKITFERIDWKIPDGTIRLKVGVGVELIFIIEENLNFLDAFTYFSEKFV